jgi:hypothetical protein
MGLPPDSSLSQPDSSKPSQQMCESLSSRSIVPRFASFLQSARGQQNNSLPELSSPQPTLFEGPILMNSDQGIILYHDIEGGPRIRTQKLSPIRKRAIQTFRIS